MVKGGRGKKRKERKRGEGKRNSRFCEATAAIALLFSLLCFLRLQPRLSPLLSLLSSPKDQALVLSAKPQAISSEMERETRERVLEGNAQNFGGSSQKAKIRNKRKKTRPTRKKRKKLLSPLAPPRAAPGAEEPTLPSAGRQRSRLLSEPRRKRRRRAWNGGVFLEERKEREEGIGTL